MVFEEISTLSVQWSRKRIEYRLCNGVGKEFNTVFAMVSEDTLIPPLQWCRRDLLALQLCTKRPTSIEKCRRDFSTVFAIG